MTTAKPGRPARAYDPLLLETVAHRHRELQRAESAFRAAVDEALRGGVSLRRLEGVAGVSRMTIARWQKKK